MSYSINETAQIKMLLHSIKYHTNDCIGKLAYIMKPLLISALLFSIASLFLLILILNL
jgi:hypothetical protein